MDTMQASKEEDELEVDELAGAEEAASAAGQGDDPASNSMLMDEDDGDSKNANAAAAALMHASASKPPSPETVQNAHAATSNSGATSANNQTAGDDSSTQNTGPECANCHTQTTSLWRRSAEGQTLCNACSLYQKMKGMPRPVSLKTDVIKHRNRSKGERKKGGPAAAAATAAASEGGGATVGASGSPGQAKKARQASVAPSNASAIREETMEEEDMDVPSHQSTDGNTSNAAMPRYPANSHPSYEQLSASLANKSRNPYDYTSISRRQYGTGNSNIGSNSNSPYHHIANATAFGIPPMHLGSSARRTASVGAPPQPGGGSKSTSPVANGSANEDKDTSRAKEFAAALALAGASGSSSAAAANTTQNQAASGAAATAAARRSISVDGRSTPNGTQTHANPLPWNIASYFSGVAERERQARAAAAALVAHSAAGTSATSNSASATASTSTSRHGTMPNSATSSATASPTGESKLQYHAQQQQPSGSENLPFHPHPHANFLAAYRARQQAASLKRDQLAKEASSAGKGKEASNSGKPEAIMAGPKEWSPVVVGPRGDPRLAALGSGSAAGAIASAAAAAGIPPAALAGMTVDQIRAAILLGWRISPHASPANSPTIKAATHPHSTPAHHPTHPGAGRSASTSASRQGSRANSRAGSRQNSPPAMSLGGPARNSLSLAAYYNRSVSTDRLSTHPYTRTTAAAHPSSAVGAHKAPHQDALSEEDREKQRQRLEQLFQAAGQRLSAYSSTSPATKAKGQQDSGTELGSGQISADAATVSAAGRTPANIHHPSYRPYDLPHSHRSSSKSGFGQPGDIKSTSSARVSPTSLASEGIGLTAAEKTANRIHRPASAASVSSSAESNADAASMAKKHDVPGITSPNLNAQLSPIFHGVQSRMTGNALADENMAIDEAEEEALDIAGGLGAHSNLDSPSPPFGVAFSSIPGGITGRAGDERRGRSTTRKPNGALDEAALEHHGDHVAHELGALRMRDSSRASSAHRESRPSSPDGYRQYAMEQNARLPHAAIQSQVQGKYPRSSIPISELDDGIVRNALTHRPISDLRASASPHPTLPSLSEALSSSGSSRSMSASQAGSSRHSSNTRSGLSYHHPHGLQEDMVPGTGGMLPPPHAGFDEATRLRTRVQELEFINSLMEARVSELENTIALNADKMVAAAAAPHGPECACRCSEIDAESSKAAEHLKKELLTHGVGHIGEKTSRDLLDLLAQRLGYHSASPSNSRGPSPNGPGVATASI